MVAYLCVFFFHDICLHFLPFSNLTIAMFFFDSTRFLIRVLSIVDLCWIQRVFDVSAESLVIVLACTLYDSIECFEVVSVRKVASNVEICEGIGGSHAFDGYMSSICR